MFNLKYFLFTSLLLLFLFEVLIRVNDNTFRAWPKNPNSWTLYDSELGWKHKKNFKTLDEFKQDVHLNNYGLREDRDFLIGDFKIVALGDSYTFGDGVKSKESWPTILGERINSEVANLGVCAYGLDQMISWYNQLSLNAAPSLVILAMIEEDITRTNLTHWISGHRKNRLSASNGEFQLEFEDLPKVVHNEINFDRNGFLDFSRSYLLDRVTFGQTYKSRAYERANSLLKEFKRVLSNKGTNLIIVKLSSFSPKFENILNDLKIEAFTCDSFDEVKGGRISDTNPHPSARGHQLISDCIQKNVNWNDYLK
ncbi:hypothetical protein BMS_2890 [Halobacteriovorax marinus SJ]|uniref:SGNH hydrolase-type esterase domain-containing protein n=1 Tax=Halobacteriovorax marinus (strain ATCC BAA-682 / DSM 15412 / SJ) TaxID=862908 RepID=E1WYM2_HALMS|nr:SGNH/GDSL hydrolase family protein [Halobacteriovorax marinus]CBW27662.1 hypothetical protein BMS_2890 [Halobacteriovorax marinus SJ]